MSIQQVTITASDEKYAPPAHEIEFAVIGNDLFITVYEGSSDDLAKGRSKAYEVPPLALCDVHAALVAFSDFSQGARYIRAAEETKEAREA